MTEEAQSHRERAEEALARAANASLYDQATQAKLSAIAELLMSIDDKLTKLVDVSTPPTLEISYGDMRAAFGNGSAA